jgi:hypothetical protein
MCACETNPSEASLRADAVEEFDAIKLENHDDLIREILVEVALLSRKYKNVRRHDIPHVAELSGLLEVLRQEAEMQRAKPRGLLETTNRAHSAAAPDEGR